MTTKRNYFWLAIVFFAIAAFELVTDLLWLLFGIGAAPTWRSISFGALFLVLGIIFMLARLRVRKRA